LKLSFSFVLVLLTFYLHCRFRFS